MSASIQFDYSSISLTLTAVDMTSYMLQLSQFLLLLGRNPSEAATSEAATKLLTIRLESAASSAVIGRLQFILTTVETFSIQVNSMSTCLVLFNCTKQISR